MDMLLFGVEPLDEIVSEITIIKKDIRNIVSDDLKGIDVVIDMAGFSNDSASDINPELTNSINNLGRVRVAKESKKAGVKKYILASSVVTYGGVNVLVDENSKVNPLTTYAKTVYSCELGVLPLADKDFCVAVLRQATVTGVSPKMRFDILSCNFALQMFKNKKIVIKGNGKEFRAFINLKDIMDIYLKVIETDKEIINGEIFNAGSENYRVGDLLVKTTEALGMPGAYQMGGLEDTRNYNVSYDKLINKLGFKYKYPVIDGIKNIYNGLLDGTIKEMPNTNTTEWYKKIISEGLLK